MMPYLIFALAVIAFVVLGIVGFVIVAAMRTALK
jgi:hypothetical protein